jgi:hypothetical protein
MIGEAFQIDLMCPTIINIQRPAKEKYVGHSLSAIGDRPKILYASLSALIVSNGRPTSAPLCQYNISQE